MSDLREQSPSTRPVSALAPDPGSNPVALFLDLDGTLVDIVSDPGAVTAPAGLVPLLGRLERLLGGALAVLSGRTAAMIDQVLAPLRLPVSGVHGAELRCTAAAPLAALAPLLPDDVHDAITAALQPMSGLRIEAKRYALAVHYREARVAPREIVAAMTAALAGRDGYCVKCGRKVVEVVPANVSKGAALQRLMTTEAFRGRSPLMIGDDATDETAFAAARRLNGRGWHVAGEYFVADDSEFGAPADVRTWLAAFADQLERRVRR